jgi:hypothetical protein
MIAWPVGAKLAVVILREWGVRAQQWDERIARRLSHELGAALFL